MFQRTRTAGKCANLPSTQSTTSFWHTRPSPFLLGHRTTSDLPKTADVVIIGSGITGAFAATALVDNGAFQDLKVVMLEAREACWGATGRNGGHFAPQIYGYSKAPSRAHFELRNWHTISELVANQDIPCDWRRVSGGCQTFLKQEYFESAKKDAQKISTISPEFSSRVAIVEDKETLTELRIPHAVGAIVQNTAAQCWPYKLVTWILEDLVKKGRLNLQTKTPVLELKSGGEGRWDVATERGTVNATHVILATNAYTSYLLPEFADLIVPSREAMIALTPTTELLTNPLTHTYSFIGNGGQDRSNDDYLVQRSSDDGGQLIFGGGSIFSEQTGIGVDDDSEIDESALQYLKTALVDELGLNPSDTEDTAATSGPLLKVENEWSGIIGLSRDGQPWGGGVPEKEGLWLVGGYSGHGMPRAPLLATQVAHLVQAALEGKDWRGVEQDFVAKKLVPEEYVISSDRIEAAREKPDIRESQ